MNRRSVLKTCGISLAGVLGLGGLVPAVERVYQVHPPQGMDFAYEGDSATYYFLSSDGRWYRSKDGRWHEIMERPWAEF